VWKISKYNLRENV